MVLSYPILPQIVFQVFQLICKKEEGIKFQRFQRSKMRKGERTRSFAINPLDELPPALLVQDVPPSESSSLYSVDWTLLS